MDEEQIYRNLTEEYKILDQSILDSYPGKLSDNQLGYFYQGLALLHMNNAKQFYLDANSATTLDSPLAEELSDAFGIQAGAHHVLAKIYREESKKLGITNDSRINEREGELVKAILTQHPMWKFNDEF